MRILRRQSAKLRELFSAAKMIETGKTEARKEDA
jgi:hypothetical protein